MGVSLFAQGCTHSPAARPAAGSGGSGWIFPPFSFLFPFPRCREGAGGNAGTSAALRAQAPSPVPSRSPTPRPAQLPTRDKVTKAPSHLPRVTALPWHGAQRGGFWGRGEGEKGVCAPLAVCSPAPHPPRVPVAPQELSVKLRAWSRETPAQIYVHPPQKKNKKNPNDPKQTNPPSSLKQLRSSRGVRSAFPAPERRRRQKRAFREAAGVFADFFLLKHPRARVYIAQYKHPARARRA